jgi:hypothetical protein
MLCCLHYANISKLYREPNCIATPGFFTNRYRGGNRGYCFYRVGTVTVPTGGNRPDSKKKSNLNKK